MSQPPPYSSESNDQQQTQQSPVANDTNETSNNDSQPASQLAMPSLPQIPPHILLRLISGMTSRPPMNQLATPGSQSMNALEPYHHNPYSMMTFQQPPPQQQLQLQNSEIITKLIGVMSQQHVNHGQQLNQLLVDFKEERRVAQEKEREERGRWREEERADREKREMMHNEVMKNFMEMTAKNQEKMINAMNTLQATHSAARVDPPAAALPLRKRPSVMTVDESRMAKRTGEKVIDEESHRDNNNAKKGGRNVVTPVVRIGNTLVARASKYNENTRNYMCYTCKSCSYKSQTQNQLVAHFRDVHGDELSERKKKKTTK